MKNVFKLLLVCTAVFMLAAACKKSEVENVKDDAVKEYARLVSNNYDVAYKDAQALKTSIKAFTASPSAATLKVAKDAWLKSRESYGVTEAFRFAGGPIDVLNGQEGPEGLLNSWPLDENYIDYVKGSPNAGIINDLASFPKVDKATLVALNGKGGEENVSVGYHAIEFLLWGQDLTSPSAKQAGKRPFTDFVDGGTAKNQARRRAYLEICADLLIEHLGLLVNEWKEGGAYRKTFLALDKNTALSKMMTGIATLSKSELAGERMFTAYDNRDQEDEHSCFSDNTHRDIRLNFDGIKNVYLGIINGSENNSIHNIVANKDKVLAEEVKAALTAAEKAVYATANPFDFAISDNSERPKVLAAVKALRTLGDKIAKAGKALGIKVGTE